MYVYIVVALFWGVFIMEAFSTNIPEILNWIERFGVSFATLCVVIYALLKAGFWIGEKIIVPVVNSYISFLTELKNAVWDIAKSNTLINSNMESLIDIQKENGKSIQKLLELHEINQEKTLTKERKTTMIPKTELSRHEPVTAA